MKNNAKPFSEYNNYTISPDKDYIILWKYFSERADYFKDRLWTICTWLFALLLAIIGFLVKDSKILLRSPWYIIIFFLVAVIINLYIYFIIRDYAKHIRVNWMRATNIKKKIIPLEQLLNPDKSNRPILGNDIPKTPPICVRLIIINTMIIFLFILAIVMIMVFRY